MKRIRAIILALACITIVVGGYFYLTKKVGDRNTETVLEETEVSKVLAKDLEKSYPKTPREVVKYYNRILCCYYNEEYTEEEFTELVNRQRQLLDYDLLSENPEEYYISNLKADIQSYEAIEKTIINTRVSDSADVIYEKVEGAECAYVTATYFTKDSVRYARTVQQYILRKDEYDDWKILGFYLLSEDDTDEE